MSWLTVIGIGEDGLDGISRAARALIEQAEVLVGSARHFAFAPQSFAKRLAWRQPLEETLPEIAACEGRRVVVLASGDPLWYGVGALLLRRFGREAVLVLPAPGAFSLAAARMGWPLAECTMLTLHGRPLARLALCLAPGARLLALSEDGSTPASVAALLTQSGWGESAITVLEHMGGTKERRIEGRASTWKGSRVADLNTLAIECVAGSDARPHSRLAGLPDDAYRHDGQLTKRVVRAATLAALAPLPGETLWDVGAGCGSIGIEWLRGGGRHAIAIEREPVRIALIAENAAALGVPELEIVAGEAPAALETLPQPDAVFLGGGAGTPGLFEAGWSRLRVGGRLVANAVTVEGEARLVAWRAAYGGRLTRIAVSEAEPLGGGTAWRPLLPVTQLCLSKARAP